MQHWVATAFLVISSASGVGAAPIAIGDWDLGRNSWSSGNYTSIVQLMTSVGNTISSVRGMLSGNVLDGFQMLVVGEPGSGPPLPASTLRSWVAGGGTLLVFTDSGDAGLQGANEILQSVNSNMRFVSDRNQIANPAADIRLAGTVFRNPGLVGQLLSVSPGLSVTGGDAVASNLIRWERAGNGRVFAFADRVEHNFFQPSATNINGRLFLDIAETSSAPEPVTGVLMGVGGALLAVYRRLR